MGNYLETLVEKMVADGVSEQDIKSVIEELGSKQSPLHQVTTSSSSSQGGDQGDITSSSTSGNTSGNTSQGGEVSNGTASSSGTNTSSEKESDTKCPEGHYWDEARGVCFREMPEVTDEGSNGSESNAYQDNIDTEVETEEIYNPEAIEANVEEFQYDDTKSTEDNFIDIQEQINYETQEYYTAEEAYELIRRQVAASKIEEQEYNPNPNIVPRSEIYNKAKNINEVQFVPENLENNALLAGVSGEMLEENGDFTLWKTELTDENGEEKVAVFPNAMANNVIGDATDGFYFTDKASAWDHMSTSSNYLLFNSQEEADSFIGSTTGEDGYEGFVSPQDYDANSSVASVNVLKKTTSQCPSSDGSDEGILEELKCIYFKTNRADKKLYPTFELFYNAATDELNKKKEWNPYALNSSSSIAAINNATKDFNKLRTADGGGYVTVTQENGPTTFSNVKKVLINNTSGEYSVATYMASGALGDIDKDIFLNNEKMYNEIHEYIFTYLPTVPGLDYDEEHMKHYFYEILDLKNPIKNEDGYNVPFKDMPFTAESKKIFGATYGSQGGFAWDAMILAYEYIMDYKMLQYEVIQSDLKMWEGHLLDRPIHRWVDIDKNGDLIETMVDGKTMLADLEGSKELHLKVDILNALNQKITTNNELLQPAVEDLNAEIEELRDELLQELEEWEIPGYDGDGVDNNLVLRNIMEVNKETSRISAIFAVERDKIIAKYERENKEIIATDKELRSKVDKELGDDAKSINNQVKLYLARISQFQATGLNSALNLLYSKYGNVLNGDLKTSLEHRQDKYISNGNKYSAVINDKWENGGFLFTFLKDSWVGMWSFKNFKSIPFINPHSSDSFDYLVKSRQNAKLLAVPLDSKYGHFSMDKGEVTVDGITYIVHAKKGKLQGFVIKSTTNAVGGGEIIIGGRISDVKTNPLHEKHQQYIIEQLNAGTVDLDTDWSWLGGSTTVGAELFKMYTIMRMTGGVGAYSTTIGLAPRAAFWIQGGFQGLAYGWQTYRDSVDQYLTANKYQRDDDSLLGNAEKYGLIMGLTTALIAQLNVEGRIGGGGFGKEAVEGLINKFISGGVMEMSKVGAIKYMSGEIGKMIIGETVEEWAEALIGEWIGKTWDNWTNSGIIDADGVKHNDIYVDMTAQDFLEMQIIVTFTAGLMGGATSMGRVSKVKGNNINEMYAYLAEILETDPTLKSLKENLELSKGEMTAEQYENASKFINEVTTAWNDNVGSSKFNYTKPEKEQLLKALVLQKESQRTVEAEEKKTENKEEDSKKLIEAKIELEIYTDLVEDIENGLFFSEGHGGTTRSFNANFNKYLSNKFPGLDHKAVQDKVNELIDLEKDTPNFEETNPKEHKLLKEIRARRKQLLKQMDAELSKKAKEKAKEDGRDPLDKSVLNRYKQLFIVEEDWQNDVINETVVHNQQVLENPVKFQELLNRDPDEVSIRTTEKEWKEIKDACVTDRQKNLVSSLYNKIQASPGLTVNLYWSGGSGVKGLSGKNSYSFNTNKNHLNGGRIQGDTIDINMEHARSNVVDHESTHHWFDKLEKDNPEAHKKMKDTLVEYIKRDPNLIAYVRFGEAYKKLKENTAKIKVDGVLETDAQFQTRIDGVITDEMIVEFLADVTSGKRPLGELTKRGALEAFVNMFKSKKEISTDVISMDFDQIINLVTDICDGYSKGKVKHPGLIKADNINVDGSKNTEHQSISIDGKRSYVVYDHNNNPIDVGAEINRLYKTDPEGAVDMSSRTFSNKILPLLNLVLENESRKSRGKGKGAFKDTPGFDLEGFQIAAIFGSSNKKYEYIYQTMLKFDPLVNDDFFGFIMTKGNKQGVFLPQMLDGLKSGDATNDFFFESLEHEQSMVEKGWDESDLTEVQLPGDDVEIDVNSIETEEVDFDVVNEDVTGLRLVDALDLSQEIMVDGKPVEFQALLDDIIFKIAGTKLPAYDEEVTTNRLKSHPFTTAIFQQSGDKAGKLRLYVQLLMGKGGDAYKNFLVENKGTLIENLTSTYLSKNIPNVVEKFVIGEGWTTDWKGKKIARYTKADGPAWAGVTSGPEKSRTIKLEEGQTWSDIISDEDFIAIYMKEKNGKYTRVQSKGEGLEYQIAGEMGLQTFLDGLKDKTSNISDRFKGVSGLSDIIITDQSIVNIENTMRRGGDKEAINIIKITQNPDKYDGLWDNLINIGDAITNLGNGKTDEKRVIKVVDDILKKVTDPKNEGKPLFTEKERVKIAKDIFELVEKYNTASKNLGEDVTLPMFMNNLLTNKLFSDSLVTKYRIVDENDKPIKIAESFDDPLKIMTQRGLPLQMVNEMIADKTMKKFEAVELLLKHYKAHYTAQGKIGRGGMVVYNKKTKQIEVVSKEKIKGNIQRYQVFENVDDFVDNVVNKIGGDESVKVNSSGVGTIDGIQVNIDTKPATQTVKARRGSSYDENLEMALESRKALMLQLTWLSGKIKDKDSGYTNEDYVMLLMSLKTNMNTVLRASANLKYDIGSSYKGKVRYEHMIPAEIVCQILADYHLNLKTKITDEMLEKFFENYNVAIISKDMDDMLKTFELISSMPIEWSPGESAIIRYYNDMSRGHADLHPLINLEDNTIVGDEFINVSNALDVDQIKSDANELKIKSDTDLTLNNIEVIKSKQSINQKPFNAETIRFFDFDETLTIEGKNVVYATSPDGKVEPVPSDKFVTRVAELTEAGYTFDFSDFVNVRGGEDGPMLQKLRNQIDRYGPKNVRILTARQPEAALAIFEWLKSKGINLPIQNIKGLGVDGRTIKGVDKAIELETYIADGYTDIEMYDDSKDVVDAINNLKEKYNVSIEGILAVENFKESINVINSKFIQILELSEGIDPDNLPTALEAQIAASKKWNFSLFPPGSYAFRDFLYRFLPKNKEGEEALVWLDEILTKPYNKGVSDFKSAKLKLAKRYKDLIKSLPKINKNLNNNIPDSTLTYDHAVRVYVWSKNGYKIPDITPEETSMLIAVVEADPELKAFADGLNSISLAQYTKPTKDWISGSVALDVSNISNEWRGKFLTEWRENVDLMFTEEVRNTLLKVYGKKFMTAFDDMLFAMEYGSGRQNIEDETTSRFRNWINNSVGAIMFLNMRSATLQTISTFNFIDWRNNSVVNAAKAFANQPQFWRDFKFLWNSDYVQSRLGDESRGITEAEINKAIKGKGNKANALISYLLKLGFTPTKIADAFAICSGGAAFYRNQTKFYETQVNPKTEELYTLEEAEAKAYLDFQSKAEESQQSADPSQISQIQRSNLGILLLSFKNTPMQYARIMLRAADDIKNNRGSKLENLGKISYYGMLQSALFVFLQQAVWAAIGDEEEEEKATDSMLQSMIDNILSGLGLTGNIIVTVKNGILEYADQESKGWNADHTYTILAFLNLSPSIGSKFRKLYSSIKTRQINADVMEEMGLEPGNPAVDAIANLISAFTNIPADRAVRKVNNVLLASSDEYEVYERLALLLGWNPWDLGIETEANIIRNRQREQKKTEKEKEKERVQKEKTADIINPVIEKEVEQYETDVKDGVIVLDEEGYPKNKKYNCAGVNSKANRCGAEVKKPGDKCQWHEDKNNDGVPDHKQEDTNLIKTQCEFVRPNDERCKNNATGTNGRCNVRQHGVGYKK